MQHAVFLLLNKVIADTSTLEETVFKRRGEYQEKILFAVGKTLSKEIKHLSFSLDTLQSKIHALLIKPSAKAANLRST